MNKLISLLLVVIISAGILCGCGASGADTRNLTKEQAEDIALEHAKLTRDQITRLHTTYELDDGVPEYEVDFHHDGTEYDYTIHADTGKILGWDKEPN